jgi:hypothetical protein
VVSNGIADRYGCSPCRTEYPVGRDELLQDLTRAVGLPFATTRAMTAAHFVTVYPRRVLQTALGGFNFQGIG